MVQKEISNDMKEYKGTFLTPGVIHIKSQETFDKWKSSDCFVVAYFTAAWCGPCQQIKPILDGLAQKYGKKAVFLTIDVDENKQLCKREEISAIPTFYFYNNGVQLNNHSFTGADISKLERIVASNVKL